MENSCPVLFRPLCVFPIVGRRVVQDNDLHRKRIFDKEKSPKTAVFGDFRAADQIRTGDLILTKDALYLLSYSSKDYAPLTRGIVATEKGLEPSTSGVTGRRSNRLNHSATAKLI